MEAQLIKGREICPVGGDEKGPLVLFIRPTDNPMALGMKFR